MPKLSECLGDYLSHVRTETGLALMTNNAHVDVSVYRKSIVRINVYRSPEENPRLSYAVVAEPQPTVFQLEEQEKGFRLKTESLTLEIQKTPVRFSFFTPDGRLINADEAGLGTAWIGDEATTCKRLQPGERFVGLGEQVGNLDRAGSAHTNWNTDYFAYPVDNIKSPLYSSLPFYIGIHSGLTYGIFLDNTHRSTFNFGAANHRFSSFCVDGGSMDYYFIYNRDVPRIIEDFSHLTGRMPLPPVWSLGYQQCRFSYFPEQEVVQIAKTFREKHIPADVIYLDIHHMDRFKVFTWDPARFPNPGEMIAGLSAMGFHVVVILDPGIKIEPGYPMFEAGKAGGRFVKYPDGEDYRGEVWPGWCHFPDFTDPEVRSWWGAAVKDFVEAGVEGFWNDMNEPSVWGHDIPNLLVFNFEGTPTSHKEARNVYGMQMSRATCEGARRWMHSRRPFVLSRAGFCGIQRYAALWTGDNVSDDAHLLAGVRQLCNLGLSGVPFAGCDVGGFAGEATPELFARWISLGVFFPLFRGHSMLNSRDAEPWAFGEAVEEIARNFIRLRYRLMPYLYATFYESSRWGLPVVRSLAVDFTHDPNVYDHDYQNQFLCGAFILVIPVESRHTIAKAYLPKGHWYDFYSDRCESGGRVVYADAPIERLPLFVKAGAIIPVQAAVPHALQPPEGPLEIHLYRGRRPSHFTYYEDDGTSTRYRQGFYHLRRMHLTADRFVIEAAEGNYRTKFKRLKICLHGFRRDPDKPVRVNGRDMEVVAENYRFLDPIGLPDASGHGKDPYGSVAVQSVRVGHSAEKIVVEWK
jgi:alpha-glucosidase